MKQQDKAKEYREKLVELAVELDDAAMEQYLEGNEPDEATLRRLIRKGTSIKISQHVHIKVDLAS